MALTSEATTLWFGDLTSGSGTTSLDSSDAGEFPVSWQARSEGVAGRTNPEELLGAAHSACYSMAFSNALGKAGHAPESLQVTAAVTFQPG
ncbi:MAG: OsmC family peroxiredoxin, partial [Pseudolysinimonas sp.]